MSKSTLTRVEGSETLVANIGYEGSGAVTNSFDSKYPWNGMEEITDADGNVWIRVPVFYSWYEVVDGVVRGRRLSEYKINDEWKLNPLFEKDGRVLPYVDIAKYLLSYDGDVHSKPGVTPTRNTLPTVVRGYVANKVSEEYEYFLMDIWTLALLQDLFAVEFATTNCQNIVYGYKYSNYNNTLMMNGTTDSIPYVTGSNTEKGAQEGVYCMKYRGIENVWGNGQTYIDGIHFIGENVYVNKAPSSYADPTSYTISNLKRLSSSGVVSQLGYDSENHLCLPIKVDTTGAYVNNYSGGSGTSTHILYNGVNADNAGLWSYLTNAGNTGVYKQGTYRLVRRLK